MTWALVLILYFGTPHEIEKRLAERLTFEQCRDRQLEIIHRIPDRAAVRCIPSETRA